MTDSLSNCSKKNEETDENLFLVVSVSATAHDHCNENSDNPEAKDENNEKRENKKENCPKTHRKRSPKRIPEDTREAANRQLSELPECAHLLPFIAPSWTSEAGPSTSTGGITEKSEEELEEVLKIITASESATDIGDESGHSETTAPLYSLFPNLMSTYPLPSGFQKVVSTTDITRCLIGTQADFSQLKPASRLIPPKKVWLCAVEEVPRDVELLEEGSDLDTDDYGHDLPDYGSGEESD